MRFLFLFSVLPFLFSFKFNPMSQSLELGQKNKSAQFFVENDTSENLAIELSVRERKMDVNGKEELPQTSELSVFPPQMIIPPKEKRTVRVVWNGPAKLETEKAFRVIAEQMNLDVDKKTKKGSGIKIMMKYMAAFYITPEDAASDLKAKLENNSLRILNAGNKHQIIANPKVTIRKGSDKWVLDEKDLGTMPGQNILAGSERVFSLTTTKKFPADAEVTLKFEE